MAQDDFGSESNMIERREAPCDVIGHIERCRAGGDEPDALGRLRQRGQKRERLERSGRVAALERVHGHVEHGHVVGHKERVEPRPLQSLNGLFDVREVEIHVRPGARIAPRAGMDAGGAHKRAEMELAGGSHAEIPCRDGLVESPG